MDSASYTVISLDPGGTTGYCIGEVFKGKLEFSAGADEMDHLAIFDFLASYEPDFVVIEDFEYRVKQAHAILISLEYIGVVELYVKQTDQVLGIRLFRQKAAQAKGGFPDHVLKRENAWAVGSPHARDATRHLLYWWRYGFGNQFGSEFEMR